MTDPLPPFQNFPTVKKQFETMSCSSSRKQSRIIKDVLFPSTSQVSESVVAVRGMVKSKEDSCSSNLVTTISESIMASKTCPNCKIFSSASNTTLKAHIDQCLDSAALPPVTRSRVKRPKKFKSIDAIYASAKRCTLEDLDQRNGMEWASIPSYANRDVADKSEVSKKRKVSSAGVGSLYVDGKGQKSRILREVIEKMTSTTPSREQHEDGISEKKCLSEANKTCLRKYISGKKHHKDVKLTNRKANFSKQKPEYQREISREDSSTGRRRIYNRRMLAKGSAISKKLNEKGHEFDALRDQPDDNDDDLWSGGDSLVLRGTDLSTTYSYPSKKSKVRCEVSGRNKTLFESKRAKSRVRMNEKEEDSLERAHTNTLRSKKSLASIQEDKYPPRKKSLAPCATSKRKLSPPFVANAGRRLSKPVELKKVQVDFSEKEDEEETRKWESEMTQELDDDYVSGDNGETNEILLRSNPPSSGYNDYNDDDDDDSEEEEDNNERVSMLANTDEPGAKLYQSDTSERLINGQTAYKEDVRFDSGVGQRSLFVEVDAIPIPGPPGSFIPSPRRNSSVITSQVQSSMDQRDRNSSASPVSAVSNFAAGRLNFPAELSPYYRGNSSSDLSVFYSTASTSFRVPSHHGTITEAERISEGITLNHQASNLLQRRAASSSIAIMNITKPPDPNHQIEQPPYRIFLPPSPSSSVLRLMGKDLIVMNQGETDEEASRSRSPQLLDPPCAETGSQINTDLYLGNSSESTHQPQVSEAAGVRNEFDHVRYFSPSYSQ